MRSFRLGLLFVAVASIIVVVFLVFRPPTFDNTTDWPGWRGAAGDLTASADGLLWGEFDLQVAWSRPLGSGYSSVAVADGRAVTMFSDGQSDWMIALDAETGDELWRHKIAETYAGRSGSDDGPLSTPLLREGIAFGLGPRGDLFAVRTTDGIVVWQRQLVQTDKAVPPYFGFATSPVLVDETLLVQTGGPDGRSITAFDPATGERRWSSGDDSIRYTSPWVAELAGTRQILSFTTKRLTGLDPVDGSVLWQRGYESAAPDTSGGIIGDDTILTQHDGVTLYRLSRQDEQFELERLWHSKEIINYAGVPLALDGYVYGYRNTTMSCVDLQDGSLVWESDRPGQGGLIMIDGHLITLGGDGNVVVVEATPAGYRERARLKVSDRRSLSPPSFANGRLFVRNRTDIVAVDIVPRS